MPHRTSLTLTMPLAVEIHHHTDRGHTGKTRYRTLAGAQDAMVSIAAANRRAGRRDHRPLNVYECAVCGAWHVGHLPTVPPTASGALYDPTTRSGGAP